MSTDSRNSFGARTPFTAPDGRSLTMYRLDKLHPTLAVDRLPFALKVLLENLLRHEDNVTVVASDVEALARWDPNAEPSREIAFAPARILLQDFTGVPAVVDLAAMRDAMAAMGGDPARVNPQIPVELVIDHSVVAEVAGAPTAFDRNAAFEFGRNKERYQFLRWGQGAFDKFKVVPPDTGICHQVNLEYLARVVFVDDEAKLAYPDTLLGTDSHTTMVNGLGVLGWGVGGIEAEAAMLGQPVSMLVPRVVGFKLTGAMPEGSTATDLVLTVTELLRRHGVVGKFVEFYGEGVSSVPLENRATIGNMSPEYGSTCAIFPIDRETLRYLEFTGRPAEQVALVEAYAKEQGLWHDPTHEAGYSERLELDLSTVQPSLAGPSRPQDRVPLASAKAMFRSALSSAVPDVAKAADAARRASEAPAASGGSGATAAPAASGVLAAPAASGVLAAPAASGGSGAPTAPAASGGSGAPTVPAASGAPVTTAALIPRPERLSHGSGGPDEDSSPAWVVNGSADEAAAESFPASDPPAPGSFAGEETRHSGPALTVAPDGMGDRYRQVVPVTLADGTAFDLDHGAVVIAAITSCTNTSNPSVMIAAGLLAKHAVERGLTSRPWVKTSLAPGSKVVIDYYERAGLMPYLEKLGFHLVGYGCTTCIGNSGPLPPEISQAVETSDLAVAAVLSGNRNFEGRINADVRMNYLASPPLVVAYALAGTMDVDLLTEPLGTDQDGQPVYLRDVWPSEHEVNQVVAEAIVSDMFKKSYREVFNGDANWNGLDIPTGQRFAWDDASTYVHNPPYFEAMSPLPGGLADIHGARVLAKLGHSVTTDHISPAGSIRKGGPAGHWMMERGVEPAEFNSYGARRGNHEVMIRGTFANIRLRNQLAPGTEGGVTRHLPDGEQMTIYQAACAYQRDGVPLLVLAGKEYGSGSSRDWAAKGTLLLGVKAVLAESFERIHRSNLLGMGVLPLQYKGDSAESLGLTGEETFEITGLAGLADDASLPDELTVQADGKRFQVRLRIDTPKEADYYRHGGILLYVLRQLLNDSR